MATNAIAGVELGDPELEAATAVGLERVEALLRREVTTGYRFVTETSLHLIDAGGKRFRPLFTLLGAQMGPRPDADEVAARWDKSPEELEHELPKGLDDRGVGDVALVLIELSRDEEATLADDRLVQLVDERRLADAGIARDQDELGGSRADHALERAQ